MQILTAGGIFMSALEELHATNSTPAIFSLFMVY
jgi:hypothetical protein